ncbi:hypothetical protein [Saccharopolyspora sp. ASAGF58]|uniref:hypothetical protein n=1 Tax=Saccharopolyspora sp. ASAGF58 TaxID=2719023 RepID=UPI00143FBE4F|nr:hypothetical protein [Saccharopolyspora sp. ASAGF58]QIZ37295.1 hypothetical protein FDZ84_25125 [Saccharopolyspora sp. ASAGF58]
MLTARPEWIIDGNYAGTMPIRLAAADTVIFLDIHPLLCLWGILQRRLQHLSAGLGVRSWSGAPSGWAFARVLALRCVALVGHGDFDQALSGSTERIRKFH